MQKSVCKRILQRVLLMGVFSVMLCACGQKSGGVTHSEIESSLEDVQCVDLTDTLRVDTVNFGRVRMGDVVSRTFALGNGSEGPVVVISTETACGCLELTYPKQPIASGEKAAATMTFYSSGYNYFYPRAFYIKTSASRTPRKIVVTADME